MSPAGLRRVHAVLTVAWLVIAVPVVLIRSLRESIPLLVFISIYANVASHFSAWQASRAEIAANGD
jgi:hypothetical protein